MKVIHDLREWQTLRSQLPGSVGLVPTMGALHAGHAALLQRSVSECDTTVLSIFLNATQFNNPADLERYPRTLQRDLELAEQLGVDVVITPDYAQMYADGYRFQVQETELSTELCGKHRPGHFTGVLTVVLKLLNLVRPHRAYFGEKDYQQYLLIRDMAQAFFLDVEIVPCATVRERSGLALSSRNELLDEAGRKIAPGLAAALRSPADDQTVTRLLQREGFQVDYVVTRGGRRYGAATLTCGDRQVRLIDNVALSQPESLAS